MKFNPAHPRRILMGFVGWAVMTTGIGRLEASFLTPADMNLLALDEAAIGMTHGLALAVGTSSGDVINYSGVFLDLGWTMSMSGTIAGMPVDISYNATFDQAVSQGSFRLTGTIGAVSLDGSGSYTFADPANEPCNDFDETSAIALPVPLGISTTKCFVSAPISGGIEVTDSGTVVAVAVFIPIISDQFSDWIILRDGDHSTGSYQATTVQATKFGVITTLVSTFDSPHVQGSVVPMIVPEPSTTVLLSAGAFGMLVYGWRKRKQTLRAVKPTPHS